MKESIGDLLESQPDYQHLQGFYETGGNYLHFTQDGRMQNYGTHVVPADDFVPVNVNQVQSITTVWSAVCYTRNKRNNTENPTPGA